ncbi:mitochondrial resolvase Ydc2 [Immersiella caudata]|uniref:Mitochondrial resolvase Ydc2 n=1 Tax=Immersiella caudata TaxID=314043 RepID=A0AA40C619_9PEZI|nr:mitochondrial resolvase Ydc2 [Immersiella caudata]
MSITRILPTAEHVQARKLTPAQILQSLASRCGISKSGTKALVKERLKDAALNTTTLSPSARILSIDLGLRNFAFSLFTVPPTSPLLSPSAPQPFTTKKPGGKQTPREPPLITLHAWRHIDLVSALIDNLPPPPTTPTKPDPNDNPSHTSEPPDTTVPPSPTFTPSTLAPLTITLILTHLLPFQPTHILIERQRFRSGSAAGVLEWTLRVNTLESMLHASLTTIKALNPSLWSGELIAVPPQRVVRYLNGEGLLERWGDEEVMRDGAAVVPEAPKRPSAREVKQKKVDLVEELLCGGRVEIGNDEVLGMVELFRRQEKKKMGRKKKEQKKKEEEEDASLRKKDDLSDCLLQGMVWFEWQRNIKEMRDLEQWKDLLDGKKKQI